MQMFGSVVHCDPDLTASPALRLRGDQLEAMSFRTPQILHMWTTQFDLGANLVVNMINNPRVFEQVGYAYQNEVARRRDGVPIIRSFLSGSIYTECCNGRMNVYIPIDLRMEGNNTYTARFIRVTHLASKEEWEWIVKICFRL
jgi:hypothetical protein